MPENDDNPNAECVCWNVCHLGEIIFWHLTLCLFISPAGLVNPALMMIPTSVAMNGQQHNIHEIRKAMTSSPAAVSPTAAQVQTATPYTTIVKDLNENSSLACNANITSLQHSPNYINTPTDHKSQCKCPSPSLQAL